MGVAKKEGKVIPGIRNRGNKGMCHGLGLLSL